MTVAKGTPVIAFIGGGNMARSLIGGLHKRGLGGRGIQVAEPNADLRECLARDFGVTAHANNTEAVRHAFVWVFAVKPQVMRAVAEALAPQAQAMRPLVISIAAEPAFELHAGDAGGDLPIVRAMPNTPALLGAGATGLHANARVDAEGRKLAKELLAAAGTTAWIPDEAQMDAVTAVSGSGPAYVFLLAEAMQAAGVAQGLAPETARALALQTIFGAARMLVETREDAAVLRQRVTSPGGTTQAALETFEAGGFRDLVGGAIAAATARGRELSAANEDPA